MNIEEIKMDHFENFEELIKTCKMWIRDDDIDAYYRFFEFNCMKALLTAYEKEKEKNRELTNSYNQAIKETNEENRRCMLLAVENQDLKEKNKNARYYIIDRLNNDDIMNIGIDDMKIILDMLEE